MYAQTTVDTAPCARRTETSPYGQLQALLETKAELIPDNKAANSFLMMLTVRARAV